MSEPTIKGYTAEELRVAAEELTIIEDGNCVNCPFEDEKQFEKTLDIAITAVCAVANNLATGQELTVEGREARLIPYDEIVRSGDRLMWLEILGVQTRLVPTSPYSDNEPGAYSVSFQSGNVQTRGLHGRQWRCWDRKPTEEQRAATPWKWDKEVKKSE